MSRHQLGIITGSGCMLGSLVAVRPLSFDIYLEHSNNIPSRSSFLSATAPPPASITSLLPNPHPAVLCKVTCSWQRSQAC